MIGPESVQQILREYADYQHRKGLWPRGHWHRDAAKLEVKVSVLCPPLSEMPAFVAAHSAEPAPEPVPEPRSRLSRRSRPEPSAD